MSPKELRNPTGYTHSVYGNDVRSLSCLGGPGRVPDGPSRPGGTLRKSQGKPESCKKGTHGVPWEISYCSTGEENPRKNGETPLRHTLRAWDSRSVPEVVTVPGPCLRHPFRPRRHPPEVAGGTRPTK